MARIDQYMLEVLVSKTSPQVRVSQECLEVLCAKPAYNPATPTGAGVSQYALEVLVQRSDPYIRVQQYCVEVLVSDIETDPCPTCPPIPTTSWVSIK